MYTIIMFILIAIALLGNLSLMIFFSKKGKGNSTRLIHSANAIVMLSLLFLLHYQERQRNEKLRYTRNFMHSSRNEIADNNIAKYDTAKLPAPIATFNLNSHISVNNYGLTTVNFPSAIISLKCINGNSIDFKLLGSNDIVFRAKAKRVNDDPQIFWAQDSLYKYVITPVYDDNQDIPFSRVYSIAVGDDGKSIKTELLSSHELPKQ